MDDRTSLAVLVAGGVSLTVATALGVLKRPVVVVVSGLAAGIVVWLVDLFTEVRANSVESIQAEDAQAAGA